jgi:chromosomal replication initiation ATPase DnaA
MKLYRDFVLQEDSKEVTDLFNKKRWPTIWGSSDFVDWVKEKFFRHKTHKDIPDSVELAPDIETIIRVVCDSYGIGEEEIKKSRRGYANEPRDVAIYLIRMLRRDTLEVIGKEFSLNRFSSVSSIFQKLKARLKKEKSLQKRVEEVKNKIFKGQT